MNIPGFTAEVSLYRTRGQYRINASGLVGTEANIFPQVKRIVARGNGSPGSNLYCPEVGDLVNECVQEGIDPSNSPEEQQAWIDTARQIHDAARARMGCSFSVK